MPHYKVLLAQPCKDQIRLIAGHIGLVLRVWQWQHFFHYESLAIPTCLSKRLDYEHHDTLGSLVSVNGLPTL